MDHYLNPQPPLYYKLSFFAAVQLDFKDNVFFSCFWCQWTVYGTVI